MARRPVSSVAADFDDVIAFLRERQIVPRTPPGQMLENARRIHRCTHSLILWRFRLKRLPEHARVFVEEIASDALQILPQALMGYSKTTKLLTRGVIENCLRHVYFSDHPIEFCRMNRGEKWYVQIEELFTYPLSHPAFLETEKRFDAFNKLKSLYSDLSAGIHGRRVQDLEMRRALKKIIYEDDAVLREAELIECCAESVNFVFAVLHRHQVRRFQPDDRRAFLHTMSRRAKSAFRDTE